MYIKYSLIVLIPFLLLTTGCDTTEQDRSKEYKTVFEKSEGTETATYPEVIDFYMELAANFPEINVQTFGMTDSGEPLHLVTFNPDGEFNYRKIREDKAILLINNGIHPGESDGIDACMLLFRDLVKGVIEPPQHTVVATIPVYNVGGALNRNSSSRANQNGPASYGFRGNARNYDLNRDFIKADTENARSFHKLSRMVDPDFFVDTHVSNGADYQYTLTYLATLEERLSPELGYYLQQEFLPNIMESVRLEGWDVTPYVNVFGRSPDTGFSQFYDSPRYSTGYMSLWNTPGIMIETHMLKPYPRRVEGTYVMLLELIRGVDSDYTRLRELRKRAFEQDEIKEFYANTYVLDSNSIARLNFEGYQAYQKASAIGNFRYLAFDTLRPYNKQIPYFNRFVPIDSIRIPEGYILPAPWDEVRERLLDNGIEMKAFDKDTTIFAEVYRISDYQTYNSPYEGHYPHRNTQVEPRLDSIRLRKGDYYIPSRQPGMRYLIETLEPSCLDSFFNWNFFDAILQRKEGYSTYVFDEEAGRLLAENPELRRQYEEAVESDPRLARSYRARLQWIYERSPYAEKAYLQYPVYRVMR